MVVTTMVVKVNLKCENNKQKIKKVLCEIPEIENQVYDKKNDEVTITVVCCCPEKVKKEIFCKGCCIILGIKILPPPDPPVPPPPPPPPPPKQCDCCRKCCVIYVGGPFYPGCGWPWPPCHCSCHGCYKKPMCDCRSSGC